MFSMAVLLTQIADRLMTSQTTSGMFYSTPESSVFAFVWPSTRGMLCHHA